MKRSIGAMLLAAVATSGKWLSGSPVLSSPGYARFRPTGAALRDPSHPAQAAALKAAAAKRGLKKQKIMQHADQSWMRNYAHHDAFAKVAMDSQFIVPLSLNPFYIAK